VKVFGQEINGLTSSIARMTLYLNGVEDFSIACGDTLRNPAFTDGSKLRTFDMVLANPPYSIKEWDRASFEHDKWGRNFLGTPPQARADYAFFQHILASMNEQTGRCAILFPHGVLNRRDERSMRKKLIELDLVETVIGVGEHLFYNSAMEACVVICKYNKKHPGFVKFIDAKTLVTRNNTESFITPKQLEKILEMYHNDEIVEHFSNIVSIEDIQKNEDSLYISKYVVSELDTTMYDVDKHFREWSSDSANLNLALCDFSKCI
ncbi:MAG: N-6 DNA methylase, partial [Prevotellaceae bacterium]|nr:N-6 DNA methylase [Candidatus Faecinaster equi]